jgi:predicted ATPase
MILWRMELLGGLRVTCQDTTVTRFRTQRAALLLAYLCLHPRQHSRDELCDVFWGESNIEDARTSLRQALSQIRHAFKDAELDHETLLHFDGNHTVGVWSENVTTDVAEFRKASKSQHWAQAKRLYNGPLLPGFWDDWLLEERDELVALYETVCQHDGEESPEAARLPEELNRFFGRQTDIAKLRTMLCPESGNRLVTLLGPGGVGKTRLSIAIGQTLAPTYVQHVAFIPLAELTDTRFLLNAIREELEIPAQANTEPLEQIADFIGTTPFLLILDNLEQLAATASAPLGALLKRVPSLTVLATSRRRLGISGERQFTVSPLDEEEGVPLFCDRANINSDASIVNLCQLLEGIPLAIELAAARVGTLTVAEMIAKIGERLTLLATQQADKSERHRSLHATMDWSVRLLTQDQREFFAALSVFRGGWTKEAAIEICEEPAALEYLSQLRDRSLIFSEETEIGIRWRMLESLREFGQEMLTTDKWGGLVTRHGEFFTHFADSKHEDLQGDDISIIQQYENEHDNFRATLERQEPNNGIVLCSHLIMFWLRKGHYPEARYWLPHFYEKAPDATTNRMRFLIRGTRLIKNVDFIQAGIYGEEGVKLARSLGNKVDLIESLYRFGDVLSDRVLLEEAQVILDEAMSLMQDEDNSHLESECRTSFGWFLYKTENFAEAYSQLNTALEIARSLKKMHLTGLILHRLSSVCLDLRDFDKAIYLCEENLKIQSLINNEYMVIIIHSMLGLVYFHQEKFTESCIKYKIVLKFSFKNRNFILLRVCFSFLIQIYGEMKKYNIATILLGYFYWLSKQVGASVKDDQIDYYLALFISVLGQEQCDAEIARGQAMSLEEAVAFAQNAMAAL